MKDTSGVAFSGQGVCVSVGGGGGGELIYISCASGA